MSFPYLLPFIVPGGADAGPADQILDHAEQALERLAEQFKNKANLSAILNGWNVQTQALEDATWGVLSSHSIETATAAGLDIFGRLVGQPRGALLDAAYRLYLAARVRINRSSGTPEDIYSVFGLIVDEGVTMKIVDYPPAAFVLELFGAAIPAVTAAVFVQLLRQTRAAGVYGELHWSAADPADTFALDVGPGLDVGHLADAG